MADDNLASFYIQELKGVAQQAGTNKNTDNLAIARLSINSRSCGLINSINAFGVGIPNALDTRLISPL